jgi:hypothetical protein
MTNLLFTVVESRGAWGPLWRVLSGVDGGQPLRPYASLEDACAVAGEAQAICARLVAPAGPGRPALPPAPGSPEYLAADARWTAHLRERTAGASAEDDLADLIDR